MKYDIESLNEEQKKALFCTEGVVLVTAGAGSGKTRLLTHRICYLIEEKHVSPYNILAITFTNKATNEMKERISQMCSSRIWISTFHSMCVRILREQIDHLHGYTRDFSIIAENDRDRIIKELLQKNNMDEDDKNRVCKHIDELKNKGLDVDEYFDALCEVVKDKHTLLDLKNYRKIAREYEEYLHKNNALDFDDLLNKTLFLFHNFPEVLKVYANRFMYVLVDEFQDTNLVQYKLVKLLCSVHKNLFVVGDEDQCIYSWRGANFHNIFNLKNDFDNVHVFKLEQNYRSSKNILTLANNVIQNNQERMAKVLWTNQENGDGPVVFQGKDERDEARFVAKTILDLHANGAPYGNFAVLMRLNALSRNMEEAFMQFAIPYKLYGGFKFYDRAEIRIAMAYFAIFSNPQDEISLRKVINFPKRGIGDVAFANIAKEAGEQPMLKYLCSAEFEKSKYFGKLSHFVATYKTLSQHVNECSLSEFCESVLRLFGLYIAYAGTDEESISRRSNLDSLIAAVREFEDDERKKRLQAQDSEQEEQFAQSEELEKFQQAQENQNEPFEDEIYYFQGDVSPLQKLSEFLAKAMLSSDSDQIQEGGCVTLSTIHAVKGLEFDSVFVIGLEEGIFPLSRSSLTNSEMEEERRLMYVAITRAEKRIFLTYVGKRFMYGRSQYQRPSRFLEELNIIEKRSHKKFFGGKEKFGADVKPEKKKVQEVFDSGFFVGDKVFHARFGSGIITEISEDGLVAQIDFEGIGKKSLMLNIAKLERLEDDEDDEVF